MDNAVTLQCQNLTCLASNPETNLFCQKCGTPLVRRYLWVIGKGDWVKNYYRPGDILEERYLFKQSQIVLDTKPALLPQAPEDFPEQVTPYLKLFAHRLHIPQIYAYIPTPDEQIDMSLWFLEYGTIPTDEDGGLKYPNLLPEIAEVWQESPAMRQLNWLWQIVQLWQPLQKQGAVSSLLNPSLLRANGRILQILELERDPIGAVSFRRLGEVWSQWIEGADSNIREFLEQLCQSIREGRVSRPEQLTGILDQALLQIGRSQKRTYQIFTATDTGPTREHNEDACYPQPNQVLTIHEDQTPLGIVCDGIGGQEGGEIASNLAIETLCKEITRFYGSSSWDPPTHLQTLEKALGMANDAISRRNDRENRLDRQRMGTTVVLGLGYAHEMYVAHVGDSRVYYITPISCHQVTTDDDLASREVRLGYLMYRDAVQYPNAGALVQALGMNGSTALHPTAQRFIIDEDCIFLLTSDGLSDYDRIEQFWASEIVPIMTESKDIAEVGQQLINLANEKNGHDNVTIALVHCRVEPLEAQETVPLSLTRLESLVPAVSIETVIEDDLGENSSGGDTVGETPTVTSLPPEPSVSNPPASSRRGSFPLFATVLLGLLGATVVGGAVYMGYKAFTANQPNNHGSQSPSATVSATENVTSPSATEPASSSPVSSSGVESLKDGAFIQVNKISDLQLSPKDAGKEEVKNIVDKSIFKVIKVEDSTILLERCPSQPGGTQLTQISVVKASLTEDKYSLLKGPKNCQPAASSP